MPAIRPYYDPADKELNKLGDDERAQRAKEIDKRWDWYWGKHPPSLKVEVGKANDNITINLCGRATDRLLEANGVPSAMLVETPDAGDDVTPAGASETAQARVDDAYWGVVEPLLNEQFLETLVVGHSFMKLWVDADNQPQAAMLDARTVTVYWDGGVGNKRTALWYRIQWKEGKAAYRQDIVPAWLLAEDPAQRVPDPSSGWVINEFKATNNNWQLTGTDNWFEEFSPIIEFKNRKLPHRYYGGSQLSDDVIQLNASVNFLATNTNRIIRYHAHPRTIVAGADMAKVQATSVDGLFVVPKDATVQNLEMQSDLSSSMAMLQQMKGEFFATMRVTDVSSIKDRIGQITNFGVRMLYSDMLEQIEEKRRDWGNVVGELTRRLVSLGGTVLADAPVAEWPDALPQNRLEVLQSAALELNLGVVSKETTATELGRNFTTESDRIADEGASANEAMADALNRVVERGAIGGQ